MAAPRKQPASDGQAPAPKEKKKHPGGESMQPPMTPMIDVVFQLLLFFLLGAQFRGDEASLQANLPKPQDSNLKPLVTPLLVTLSPAGENNRDVVVAVENVTLSGIADLETEIRQRRNAIDESLRGKLGVKLKPVGNVRWEYVVGAFNQALLAEIKLIGFEDPDRRGG